MNATEGDDLGRSPASLGGEDLVLRRARRQIGPEGASENVIAVSERAPSSPLGKLAHEFELAGYLDRGWALRPLDLLYSEGRATLLLEDPGGELLANHLAGPMEIETFLSQAVGIAGAVSKMHQQGLIHKDIKPGNILVDLATGSVRLTGFGIASRLPRERQAPEPPAIIAGTLAYMAPEQTGRMNRSIDSRSDLYALGVTYYQMLTGMLPFTAVDPMEWVHCHVARSPPPPHRRLQSIPLQLSDIVMKLLAKTAEDRYQTAAGVERDLQHCLADWRSKGDIGAFIPGETDASDRLSIPEKLYGRGGEVRTLLDAFDRVVAGGRPELVLVSGYSGIGKSAVVNELHKALAPHRGSFASGKFDQYKRDIPYATLAQAFQSLLRPLLGKSEAELRIWRERLSEALGQNGALIANLAPILKLIIGDQPPVPALPSRDAQARFQLVCRKFIGVFATREQPLALFLDDLQWLDLATLDLLEDLLSQTDVGNLLLIGAYRDNEVDLSHPLMRRIEAARQSGAHIQEIVLTPMDREDLTALVADALHCGPEGGAEPLAHLVHTKTGGNPFFAIQFLSALPDDGLLVFDHGQGRWAWDLARIRATDYTDNVIDLMIAKLNRLPDATLEKLKQFACLGNRADVATLAILQATSEDAVHRDLWEAQRQEFIMLSDGSYKFVHDRIQEAAYSLIPAQQRPHTHLRIGRLLAARASSQQREEVIFDIVNQLNRGASLITSEGEREQLAEFNLIAGARARASAAYASALNFFVAGAAQISGALWLARHDLAFALEFQRSECEFLTGELAQAEERLRLLAMRSANLVERARVASLRIDLYTVLDETDRVVAAALDYLRHLGIEWSPHPGDDEARREYEQIWTLLGDRAIKDIFDLPLMTDQETLATLDVLTKLFPTANLFDANLLCLTICRAINLSLIRGNSDASCVAYVHLASVAGPRFGDYEAAFAFGQVGYDLVEHRDLQRFQARIYHWLAQYVLTWNSNLKICRALTRRAHEAATRVGDLGVAVYSFDILNANLFGAGDPLAEAQRQAEIGLEFTRKARFGHQIDVQATQLALVKTLRGLTYTFGEFDDGRYSETEVERHASPHPAVYWIRKLQARFFAGNYPDALDAAEKARPKLWTLAGMFETAEYHFFAALAHAGSCLNVGTGDGATAASASGDIETLEPHYQQLQRWAKLCPDTFESRAALVGAELARLQGREWEAESLYESAIHSARSNGFVHIEALAYELAARSYAARGRDEFALLYLRNARARYLRWGAEGKVRQLDETFPQLATEEASSGQMRTIGTTADRLDLATVIKASQAVSSEIFPERLIVALMRTVVEHAGAQRGVLIVVRGEDYRIEAEATTDDDAIDVQLREARLAEFALPETIVHFVARTRQSVVLDDATAINSFSADPFLSQRQTRSILCLPLIKQATLVGMLYLENNLAARVFTPARISLLELIASQAAISLENTRLYSELEEREAKIRRLVDANIMGIFIWNDGGEIVEANEAFLRIVGYDRAELGAGGMRWMQLTSPEWRDDNGDFVARAAGDAINPPREREFLRKDGSRAPVLLGSAALGGRRNEGVAFVVDLTERKRAEAQALETERRYQEVQLELEHANRIATIGQLSASIAHEVNQPIAAAITNAHTALRWLDLAPPNMEKARQAVDRILQNGNRANEVISGIRALIRKDPPRHDPLAMNDIVLEVVNLTQGETTKHNVWVRTQLAKALPIVRGDKVQLQQVIMNLVMNAVEAMTAASDGARELLVSTGELETEGALVSVADSGPGLNSAWSERMFEAFNTTKASGLGMGLAICRTIVEAHGGRLWAAANAPRGALFQFTVPFLSD